MDSWEDMSIFTGTRSPGSSTFSGERAPASTRVPERLATSSARARPMPRLAPVMRTVGSVRSIRVATMAESIEVAEGFWRVTAGLALKMNVLR